MPNLRRVGWKSPPGPGEEAFPFSVPAIRSLRALELTTPVTFFVGENGSGKSTLLEGIAAAADVPTLGSEEAWHDPSLAAQRTLARALQLTWTRRTRWGFFLRAEDFFGYLRRLARNAARIDRERWELGLDAPPPDPEDEAREDVHADEAASGRYLARYDARSHGESFLELFRARVEGGGLYLLDEPEAPLSPQRQLALLAILGDAVREGCQFVIATHSPILLAYPGATIYSFDASPVRPVRYGELEHVTLTRDFLNAPERFLRHLL